MIKSIFSQHSVKMLPKVKNNGYDRTDGEGSDKIQVTMTATRAIAMARRERFSIAPIGEFYRDLLEVDAWINARTASTQANNLLCSKLQEREDRIRERVAYLAKKRGITVDEFWKQILKGEAVDLAPDEIAETEE